MEDHSTFGRRDPAARRRKTVSILSVAVFVLLLVLLTVFVGRPLLANLKNPEEFRAWVDARGTWGRVLFVGMIVLEVVVAFIPAEPLEIAAGYAFGAVWGTVLVWIGLILGSLIVFLFVRRFGVRAVEPFFPREKIDSVRFLNSEKKLNAAAFVLFLIPGTPKDLLTYCAGLTKIRLLPWLLLTSVARLPSVVTSTVGGDAIGEKEYLTAFVVFAATAAVSAAGMLLYRAVRRKRDRREAARRLAAMPLSEPGEPESSADEPDFN